ncbi:MAG TPA: MarR family winged helix-turn-helix transcriptional regulator [Micrococcaceae bacterium]|jgi:DNA-binding MarR family transcriptional regulator
MTVTDSGPADLPHGTADRPGAGAADAAGFTPASDAAVESAEQQLSLFWRRTRAISQQISRAVHPDMDPAAYGLLTVLAREGSMRLTDLAACIGVGKPSVSRQVTFLESIGLVAKQADPTDGRAQNITLSETGKERMHRIQADRRAAIHEKLGAWSEDELVQLSRLMARLNAEYAQLAPREPGSPDHH